MKKYAAILAAFLMAGRAAAHHPHDVATIVRPSPDYARDRTIYVAIQGTFDILLRSSDGGTTWRPTHEGMSGRLVHDLAFSPDFANDSTIYVGTDRAGVDISTDGGDHWSRTAINRAQVHSIALSPNFAEDGILFAGTNKGLYRSEDGGATVEIVLEHPDWPIISALRFSNIFASDGTILAAADEAGLLVSTDGGLTWEEQLTGFEPITVRDVAIAPNFHQDPTIILATTESGIIATHDAGATWERYHLDTLPIDPNVTAVTMSPDYADDREALVTTAARGMFRTVDGGNTWLPVDLPYIPYTSQTTEHFRGVSFSPDYENDGEFFVAMFEGLRIYRPYAPEPWFAPRLLHTRLARRVQISPSFEQDPTIVATAYGFEVLFSNDAGRTWEIRNQGSSSVSNYALALSPDFATDGRIMSGTGWGVEISTDRGMSWNLRYFNEGSQFGRIDVNSLGATKAIQFSPAWEQDGTLFAGNWWTIQKSVDGGIMWDKSLDLRQKCYDMAISPNYTQDELVFAVTPSGILRTTDAGASWHSYGAGLVPSGLRFIELSPDFAQDSFAVIGHTATGVDRSFDAGANWESQQNRMPDPNLNALVVSGESLDDLTIAVATHGAGVTLSTDAGTTWETRWPDGLEGGFVECLALSPNFAVDGTMIAGCYGGFYMTWDGGYTWTRTTSVERYDDRREDTALWSPSPEVPLLANSIRHLQPWRRGKDFDWYAEVGAQYAEGVATIGCVPESGLRFEFDGTGVDWIGARTPSSGAAVWRLDGSPPDTLDLYSPVEEWNIPVLSLDGLYDGHHVLKIGVVGEGDRHNWDQQVIIDAFDVHYGEASRSRARGLPRQQ